MTLRTGYLRTLLQARSPIFKDATATQDLQLGKELPPPQLAGHTTKQYKKLLIAPETLRHSFPPFSSARKRGARRLGRTAATL